MAVERLYYKQRVAASQGICLNDETSTFDREENVKLSFGKILKSLSLLYFSKEWELLFKYLFTFIKTVRADTFVTNDLHFSGKTNRIFPPCDDIVGGWLSRVRQKWLSDLLKAYFQQKWWHKSCYYVGFKTKWAAVHTLGKVQTLSGVNWPNSHPLFAQPVHA